MLIGGNHNVERKTNMIPFAEILAVLVENLDAAGGPIRDVHPAVRVNVDRVRENELGGPGSLLAPGHQVLSALIDLDDARVDVTVANEKCAVRKPGDVGGASEVLVVFSLHALLAERHHQLLAVVCELEDLMQHIVDDPYVLFCIVRADFDVVRSAAAGK